MLPAFVAEMDFDLAEPIIAAVTSALGIGDCGYPHFGQLPDAFAQFAAQRLGWTVEPSRVFAIPDVMTGLAEVVQAITPPGSGIVINPPVLPTPRSQLSRPVLLPMVGIGATPPTLSKKLLVPVHDACALADIAGARVIPAIAITNAAAEKRIRRTVNYLPVIPAS